MKKGKSPKGWDLFFYGEKKYRAYMKGNYIIRQMHFGGAGHPVPNKWEVLVGDRVIAVCRSREIAVAYVEQRMERDNADEV